MRPCRDAASEVPSVELTEPTPSFRHLTGGSFCGDYDQEEFAAHKRECQEIARRGHLSDSRARQQPEAMDVLRGDRSISGSLGSERIPPCLWQVLLQDL